MRLEGAQKKSTDFWNRVCTPKQSAMSLFAHRRKAHPKTTRRHAVESAELHTMVAGRSEQCGKHRLQNAAGFLPAVRLGQGTLHANEVVSTLRQIVRAGGCGRAWVNSTREVAVAYLQPLHI